MKLGIICERNANSFYRAIFPLRALQRRGHEVVWPGLDWQDVPLRRLVACDLVHCYRRTDRLDDLRELARHGVAISFDNDDDFLASEAGAVGVGLDKRRHYNKIARETIAGARLADLVTTTSERLVDFYRAAGAEHVVALGNHLEDTLEGFGSPAAHDGVVVGWVAAIEHRTELERIPIASALRELLAAHPDLRVLSVGLRLPLGPERYEHVDRVNYVDLIKTANTMDIGIAPLVDTPFNRARSDVKLKEYASAGAAWLASPVGPYAGLGEAEGGMLVADGDWTLRIDELVRKGRRRRKLAKRGLRWARNEVIDRHVARWESAFLDAIDRAQSRRGGANGAPRLSDRVISSR